MCDVRTKSSKKTHWNFWNLLDAVSHASVLCHWHCFKGFQQSKKASIFFSVVFLLDVARRSYQKCCFEVSFERKLQENLPHLLQSRRAVTPNQDKPSRFQAFMQRRFMARITGRTPYKYTCAGFFCWKLEAELQLMRFNKSFGLGRFIKWVVSLS